MNGADLEMVATLLAAKHLDALKLKDWTLAAFSLYQMGQLDDRCMAASHDGVTHLHHPLLVQERTDDEKVGYRLGELL